LLNTIRYTRFTADEYPDTANINSEQNEKYLLNGVIVHPIVEIWSEKEKEYWLEYDVTSENDSDVLINKVSVFLICDGEYIPILEDEEVNKKADLEYSSYYNYYYDIVGGIGNNSFYIDTDELHINNIKRRKITGLKVVTNVTVDGDTKNMESTYTAEDEIVSGFMRLVYSV
jgi:hypothetical protein